MFCQVITSSDTICQKYILVKNASGDVGLLDMESKTILHSQYKEVLIFCNHPHLLFAKTQEGYEVYTVNGERILDFFIADYSLSYTGDMAKSSLYYKFMKTDGNYLELIISKSGTYRFVNKPLGSNSVRIEQAYNPVDGLSLWRYKVKKDNYDSGAIYSDVCFNLTCLEKYKGLIDLEKIKTYAYKSVAILPSMAVRLYKHDGSFYEIK